MTTPLEVALERLERLNSPLTGITTVDEVATGPDQGRFFEFVGELHSTFDRDGAVASATDDPMRPFATGRHPERPRARAAVLGEAAERYSAQYLPLGRFIYASASELATEGVLPADSLRFYTRAQLASPGFPHQQLTDEMQLRWIQASRLADGKSVYVPAQLAVCTNAILQREPHEPQLADFTSNGIACGCTPAEAILGALLELIERDAIMLTWYNRLTLPVVNARTDAYAAQIDDEFFQPSNVDVRVVDLSIFHSVPTMLAVARGRHDDMCALSVGAGAAADPITAWIKAKTEVLSLRPYVISLRHKFDGSAQDPTAWRLVETLSDHAAYFANHHNAAMTEFLDSGVTRPIGDVAAIPHGGSTEQLEWIAVALERRGIDVYSVDITSPDIASVGLCVYRVIAPRLCPLDVAYARRYLGVERLYVARSELGGERRPMQDGELNTLPHPFA